VKQLRSVALRVFFASLTLLPVLVATSRLAVAENSAAVAARVGEDIRYLASDELEGRGAGTDGLLRAAEFLQGEFAALGLRGGAADGSFFQPFEIGLDTEVVPGETSLVLHGPDGQKLPLKLGEEFQALAVGGGGSVAAELVFAGYGISAPDLDYDDYAVGDVEGKVVLILRREPQQDEPKSAFDGRKVTSHSYIQSKIEAAKKAGAAAVIFVNDPHSLRPTEQAPEGKADALTAVAGFGAGGNEAPFAQLTIAAADRLLATTPVKTADGEPLQSIAAIEAEIDATYRTLTQPLAGWKAELKFTFKRIMAELVNVVGVLEAAGPLADETIVIGAHYDHLGFGPFGSRRPNPRAIHPGADDNATGTAAMLELARRFAARGTPPVRRLVFIGFSGEERGLLGSRHYVEKPLIPLNDTVAMVNFDMIGQLREDKLIVNAGRSAVEFPAMLDAANVASALNLDLGRNLNGGDHGPFYRKDIPCVHFFSGVTSQYHTPDDVFETIDVGGVVRTIDLGERFVDAILQLPSRPQFVKIQPQTRGVRGSMAYLGVTPDYSGNEQGLKITEVANDSPAARGGLAAGDVIVRFGEAPVADIQGLSAGLRSNKPGDKVKITVRRGDKEVPLEVTLGAPGESP